MTASPVFRRSLAVVVGIDRYDCGIPALRTAVADARQVGDILATKHGYEVRAFLDGEATRDRLLRLFTSELPQTIGPDDRVFFYFAGHGVAVDGDEGPNGYLLLQDAVRADPATYLHMPRLHDALLALECRHMLVVLDSCFSGAFRWSSTRDVMVLPEVIHQERFERFLRDPAWQVITSAADDQQALDVLSNGALGSRRDGDGAHSPFALALFEALEGAGDLVPRSAGDGVITATELYLYLEQRLQPETIERGTRQTPRLWPLRKHDNGEFIFLAPGHALNLPPAPALTYANNPYQGLASYDREHAPLFFGRRAVIDQLRTRVARPLTVVLGASGTGKSSVVKAGLLPALEREAGWHILPVVRPGASPLSSLLAAVNALAGASDPRMPADAVEARAIVAAWCARNPGTRLVLVVDQLEELVTLTRSVAERDAALALLAALLDDPRIRLHVVLTLRSDFEPQFFDSALDTRWRDARYVVPPLSPADLREAIERPASHRVLYFEPPSLVDALITEVIQTPGALPLLSFMLSEMYVRYVNRRSDDRALTRDDYDALGGVVGALRHRANEEYDAMDAAHQATMRHLMLRMVATDAGAVTRRRVPLSELAYPSAEENARVARVVDALVAGRLLVRGSEADGTPYVEPAHDALVAGWDRLIGWLHAANAEGPDGATRRRLAGAAAEWDAAGPRLKRGLLWKDAGRCALVSPLLRTRAPWLNRRELAFVRSSVRARWFARASASAVTALIAIGGFAALYLGQQARLEGQRARVAAVVLAAPAQADPLNGVLLLASLQGGPQPPQALPALARFDPGAVPLAVLRGHEGAIVSAAFSPDGERIATVSADQTVRLWRADGAGQPGVLRGHADAVRSAAFSPDGTLVLTASDDGTARVWRADGSGTPVVLRHDTAVWSAAFGPDGSHLVTASADGIARVWRTDGTGLPVALAGHEGGVWSAAFSPDGARIVTASDDATARVWPASGSSAPLVLQGHEGGVWSAAFSADGSRIVTASADGTARVWRAGGRGDIVVLRGHTGPVWSAAFIGTGDRVLTASADGTARVWRADGAGQPTVLQGHTKLVTSATLLPDRQQIVTTSDDGTARVWRADGGGSIVLRGHDDAVSGAAVSPSGDRVVTASGDGTARVWRVGDAGGPAVVLRGHLGPLSSATFSRDGARVVTASADGTARVWSRDGAGPVVVLAGHEGPVRRAAFSPDGRGVVTASEDRTARIWRSDGSGEPVVLRGHTGAVMDAVFSPDGQTVVSASADGTAGLWRTGGGAAPAILRGHAEAVTGASFSPDGSRVVTVSADRTARVWRVDGPDQPVVLRGHEAAVTEAVFSPDGSRILTVSADDTVRVWRADGAGTPVILHGRDARATRSRSVGELESIQSARFSPDGMRIVAASADRTIRVWGADGTGTPVVLRGHEAGVVSAAFSPDGTRIVTASTDRTVRVWRADGVGTPVILRGHDAGIVTAHFSPDGERVVTASADGTARVWRVTWDGLIGAFVGLAGRHCLNPSLRAQLLGESEEASVRMYDDCERRNGRR